MTANGIADPGVFWRRSLTTVDETEKNRQISSKKRRTPTHPQTQDTDSIRETDTRTHRHRHTHTHTHTHKDTHTHTHTNTHRNSNGQNRLYSEVEHAKILHNARINIFFDQPRLGRKADY